MGKLVVVVLLLVIVVVVLVVVVVEVLVLHVLSLPLLIGLLLPDTVVVGVTATDDGDAATAVVCQPLPPYCGSSNNNSCCKRTSCSINNTLGTIMTSSSKLAVSGHGSSS